MSRRKLAYGIGVVIPALLSLGLQIGQCVLIAVNWEQTPLNLFMKFIPGRMTIAIRGSSLDERKLSDNQFVRLVPSAAVPGMKQTSWSLESIDPEAGVTTNRPIQIRRHRDDFQHQMKFGSRVFFVNFPETVDRNPDEVDVPSYELIHGEAVPSSLEHVARDPLDHHCFLYQGKPAFVESTPNGFEVSVFDNDQWNRHHRVELPDPQREWRFGDVTVTFQSAPNITCISEGERIHVFVSTANGQILYREGLDLRPIPPNEAANGAPALGLQLPSDEPVNALYPSNTDAAVAAWSLVPNESANGLLWSMGGEAGTAMLVGGRPAVLIVDGVHGVNQTGRLYSYDDGNWSLTASNDFPLATVRFLAIPCQDGQKSYLVSTTGMGHATVYAVEPSGFRKTMTVPALPEPLPPVFYVICAIPLVALLAATGVGFLAWRMMWRFAELHYEFGDGSVELASIALRGLARLIDVILVIASTTVLAWLLTRNFDWESLSEAFNLNIPHRSLTAATNVVLIVILWLTACLVTQSFLQGRWGVTVGKWICGLRTRRTTLRPCGFARSLLREILICIDTCNFLCWLPGILTIVYTRHSQRIGDLIADTIVIRRAKSH